MRLVAARIQNYRSVRDTGWFDIEDDKTILVGPNEAGKTVVLEALKRINAPEGVAGFNPLRDYPRALYNADIQSGCLAPKDIPVVFARFKLDENDLAKLPEGFDGAKYLCQRQLDNSYLHKIVEGPAPIIYTEDVRKDLLRMAAHVDERTPPELSQDSPSPSSELKTLVGHWLVGRTPIEGTRANKLRQWLDGIAQHIDETNRTEEHRHTHLLGHTRISQQIASALETLKGRLPVFVYFNNYHRVHPNIHLGNFATRVEQELLDDASYDYGNLCLLKLLGFNPRDLATLGSPPEPGEDKESFENYRSQLDERRAQLNAASVRLTKEIRSVWNPDPDRVEASILRIVADGQHLKVVVEDDLGVEIELDQRSEGFQWLVSFFVVFFAEVHEAHSNAVLLLDEPGLSLHGLKQRDFRETISRLAKSHQTIYTTHSPFLVGPDELDLVRVVEMTDHNTGTVVHTNVTASDPAALLPLQEALGYDLAQSLFVQTRNFVLEGLTDYWYFEATSQLLASDDIVELHDKIALVPAQSAGKVVYFATILHANRLKVAALLDSDNAGDSAATQETLVHKLGNKNILRTADFYKGPVPRPEIEDLLRDTLVAIAKDDLNWDVSATADDQPARPIVDIFEEKIETDFSKYKLAKAYIRWTRQHKASDLMEDERDAWVELVKKVNRSLQ